MVFGGFMTKIKLIVLGSVLAFLGLFYLGSIYVAYNKGYNKHALEMLKKASEVVLGSHTDILVASEKVKEKERDIINDEVCSAIWNFDLRKCLH